MNKLNKQWSARENANEVSIANWNVKYYVSDKIWISE